MMKHIITFILFISCIYTLKSQDCLKTQVFKLKDAKCIVNGQQVYMPFNIDAKTFKDSINLIIYEPGNKIQLGLKISAVDTCEINKTTGVYKGVFKAIITEEDEEDSHTKTESKVRLIVAKNIYTFHLILPKFNNNELILTMVEVKKRSKK
jgi:hypothetical protein